jgi:toxin YoeB
MWRVVFTKQGQKDAKKLSTAGLRPKAEKLIEILRENPYQTPPPFEKLLGDLSGAFSRRINIQHRLVYQILDDEKVVKIIRMWTHYEWQGLTILLCGMEIGPQEHIDIIGKTFKIYVKQGNDKEKRERGFRPVAGKRCAYEVSQAALTKTCWTPTKKWCAGEARGLEYQAGSWGTITGLCLAVGTEVACR